MRNHNFTKKSQIVITISQHNTISFLKGVTISQHNTILFLRGVTISQHNTIFFQAYFTTLVSAGIRVGWITGPTEVISKVELHTQVCDEKSLSPFDYVIILGVDNALSSTGPSYLFRTFENLGPKRIRKSRRPSSKLL